MNSINYFRVKPLLELEAYRDDSDYYFSSASLVAPMLEYAGKIIRAEWWEEDDIFFSMGYAWSIDYCEELNEEDVDNLIKQDFIDEMTSKIENGNVSLYDLADAINRIF